MKKFLASILRLSISYGKFAVMLFTLSLIKTGINENPNFRYLSKSSQYLKICALYVGEQQNIRRNKFCPKNFLNVDKKLNLNSLNINHEQNRRKVWKK